MEPVSLEGKDRGGIYVLNCHVAPTMSLDVLHRLTGQCLMALGNKWPLSGAFPVLVLTPGEAARV